jgi:hypothetical protein
MPSSKTIDMTMDFTAGVYLFRGPEPHNPPPPAPLHTVYVYAVYTYPKTREVGEGGELNQRKGEGGKSSQSWVENTNRPIFYMATFCFGDCLCS